MATSSSGGSGDDGGAGSTNESGSSSLHVGGQSGDAGLGGQSGDAGLGGQSGDAGLGGDSSTTSGGAAGMPGTGGTDSGGTEPTLGGTGGVIVAGACVVLPDPNGAVVADDDCQIQGLWYSYSDCTTSSADCTRELIPAENGQFPNDSGRMCTSGTTASINSDAEVVAKWGAGIGLSLNQQPGGTRETIATLSHPLIGFRFQLSGTHGTDGIRVNFPTPSTEREEHFQTVIAGADQYEVYFSDLAQGDWVAAPTVLDPSQINAIQFQIPARFGEEVPFNYCVENLQALY